ILQHVTRTDKCLLVTGTPVFDEEGNISLVVVNERDMTRLSALQEQLDKTRMLAEKFRDELVQTSMLELEKQEIIAENEDMKQVLRVALKLARLKASNILILGESGTGKGLLAKFIHKNSERRKKPFIQINCAALPENLLEGELFGYEKGAFTGAREQGKVGLFELAQEGTLFLDEIGDLPLSIQAKLLKYLDDHEVMRLGGTKPKKVDCTVIAATNRDPEILRRGRTFREDLYYRLSTFTIRIPPLRKRPEDIFELTNYFLHKYNKAYGLKRRLSRDAIEALQHYAFPGNVRELENILKKAIVLSEGEVLDGSITRGLEQNARRSMVSGNGKRHESSLVNEVLAVERDILKDAIARFKSTRDMASHLGVSQPAVVRKMRKHGLSRLSMQQ
ncbi:MAG: sigma 54-interacting transcriptional regulator, partial [Deltaproteobacteria bacterium]|nr:sigma 54-interacting transcriptional regulator [Deltaproteobacteria bacterium]